MNSVSTAKRTLRYALVISVPENGGRVFAFLALFLNDKNFKKCRMSTYTYIKSISNEIYTKAIYIGNLMKFILIKGV